MRVLLILASVAVLSSAACSRAALPRVAVGATLVERTRHHEERPRHGWSSRVTVVLAWTEAEQPATRPPEAGTRFTSGAVGAGPPCRLPFLCLWELRARELALRRLRHDLRP